MCELCLALVFAPLLIDMSLCMQPIAFLLFLSCCDAAQGPLPKSCYHAVFTSQLQNHESHNHFHKVPSVMATCNITRQKCLTVSLLLLSTKPNNVFAFCAINAFKLTDMQSHNMVSGVLTVLKLWCPAWFVKVFKTLLYIPVVNNWQVPHVSQDSG